MKFQSAAISRLRKALDQSVADEAIVEVWNRYVRPGDAVQIEEMSGQAGCVKGRVVGRADLSTGRPCVRVSHPSFMAKPLMCLLVGLTPEYGVSSINEGIDFASDQRVLAHLMSKPKPKKGASKDGRKNLV